MSGGGGDRTEEADSRRRRCCCCCCCGDDDDDEDDDDDDDDGDGDDGDGCCRMRGCHGPPPPTPLPWFESAFKWTLFAIAFASVAFAVAYVALAASRSPYGRDDDDDADADGPAAAVAAVAAAAADGPAAASREFCSAASADLYWLERVGYVDGERRASKLMALRNVSARDVHYVFADAAHVPWLHACSLESAVRAVDRGGRVNAFVVYGMQPERRPPDGPQQPPLPLTSSLAELTARYGGDRLNVVRVDVKECLRWSPFQGVDMSGRPSLAAYAVRLVLVWQFGGTSLDAGVVAVRGRVYRAAGAAVEYGNRTVSAAAACHAFVYDAMLCARSYAAGGVRGARRRRWRPFAPDTGRRIAEKARWWSDGRAADAARPAPEWLVCGGGVVGGRCYYVETDGTPLGADSYLRGFCPAVSEAASAAAATKAAVTKADATEAAATKADATKAAATKTAATKATATKSTAKRVVETKSTAKRVVETKAAETKVAAMEMYV